MHFSLLQLISKCSYNFIINPTNKKTINIYILYDTTMTIQQLSSL